MLRALLSYVVDRYLATFSGPLRCYQPDHLPRLGRATQIFVGNLEIRVGYQFVYRVREIMLLFAPVKGVNTV